MTYCYLLVCPELLPSIPVGMEGAAFPVFPPASASSLPPFEEELALPSFWGHLLRGKENTVY